MHEVVGLSLGIAVEWPLLQYQSDAFSNRFPWSILQRPSSSCNVIWDFDVETRLECTMVGSVLRVVNLTFENASIKAVMLVRLLSCEVLALRGRKLSRLHLLVNSVMGSTSPCHLGATSSPTHDWP